LQIIQSLAAGDIEISFKAGKEPFTVKKYRQFD
jgi:hypothetical protein